MPNRDPTEEFCSAVRSSVVEFAVALSPGERLVEIGSSSAWGNLESVSMEKISGPRFLVD